MKYSELTAKLKEAGCYITRHGANHDWWHSSVTGKTFLCHGTEVMKYQKVRNKRLRKRRGFSNFSKLKGFQIMKVSVIIEKATDGFFSCYMENDTLDFGLIGHGKTTADAKADLLAAYDELAKMQEVPALDFEFKYDLHSFFDYFSVLNVTKLAEKTGINPSLLRQYRSGVAKAGQKQYDKLEKTIHKIGTELATAKF